MSKKSSSNYVVTFLIGIITISFMFTGYESMKGSADTLASVNGEPIKLREYQQEYNRQINFYKNIFGGKDLTQTDIKRFRIKQAALDNLIRRKLMLGLSAELSGAVSPEEIKNKIKNLPYFQTNKQFDINKYKSLLRYNSLTPSDFEEQIKNDIKLSSSSSAISKYPLSKSFTDSFLKIKKSKSEISAVQINKVIFEKFIPVSNAEVIEYLAKKENMARVQSLFKDRKISLDRPEQVKASHILIRTNAAQNDQQALKKIQNIAKKLTTANFGKMAKKHSEDPGSKIKNGELGFFGRGMMDPAFEKVAFSGKVGSISTPVKSSFGYHIIYIQDKKAAKEAKLEDYKNDLAKEMVRKTKTDEKNKLIKEVQAQITSLLEAKKDIKKIASKYQLNILQNQKFNAYEGIEGNTKGINLSMKEQQEISSKLNNSTTSQIFQFDTAKTLTIISASPFFVPKEAPNKTKDEQDKTSLQREYASKLQQKILEVLKSNAKIKVYQKDLGA